MKKFYDLKGFSLMELLITIAIMGILTSIALPSYQHYTQRARFAEILMAVLPYKMAIAIALQAGEPMETLWTGQNNIPPSPASTKNLAQLKVERGVITATATQAAGGYTYILTPDDSGSIWTVSGTCLEVGVCPP